MLGIILSGFYVFKRLDSNMKAKQDKYIDLTQFPHNDKGQISWKNSVGTVAEFFYNGERHELEILDRINKDYLEIRVDDVVIDKAHTSKITGLMFDNVFYKPDYFYKIGDVVNGLLIVAQTSIKRKTTKGTGKVNAKAYNVKCTKDGYEFVNEEWNLKNGHGCPVCSSKIVVKGINDIATTDPNLIALFSNVKDAYKYTRSSMECILVKCPYCGFEKKMTISELTNCGYVTCDKCSDGISYPNKFAHELFNQINSQYEEYQFEYSPDWAGRYRYDNYIKLSDGTKFIVEMDGGFHYLNRNKELHVHDAEKDALCKEHGIKVIRIDCNYIKTHRRYEHVKQNIINGLSDYFDLSCVDWDKCNDAGISNFLFEVIEYYNNNQKLGLDDIAKHFGISTATMYSYMYIGEDLGLCTYVRADSNRIKNSKPVSMFDVDGGLIGIFKSAKRIEEAFPEKNFKHRSIRESIHKGVPYKGYVFKFATFEEYQAFDETNYKSII